MGTGVKHEEEMRMERKKEKKNGRKERWIRGIEKSVRRNMKRGEMRTDGDREQDKRECWLMKISYAARSVKKGTPWRLDTDVHSRYIDGVQVERILFWRTESVLSPVERISTLRLLAANMPAIYSRSYFRSVHSRAAGRAIRKNVKTWEERAARFSILN